MNQSSSSRRNTAAGSGVGFPLADLKPLLRHIAVFSLAINVLLLVPSLYMLQLFDRVITSRSTETLALLTLATCGALLAMAVLDFVRSRLLVLAGEKIDKTLSTDVLERLLHNASRPGGTNHGYAMRDVNTLRMLLAGPGIFALLDAPWLPIYLVLIYLFHPLLGVLATAGGGAMILLAVINERRTRPILEASQRSAQRAATYLGQGMRNAELINALGIAERLIQRWRRQHRETQADQIRVGEIGSRIGAITKLTRQGIQILMLGAGAYLVLNAHVTTGVMMASTIILGRALQPVELLIAGWRGISEARAAYGRLAQLLSQPASSPAGTTELPKPTGTLMVEKLVFASPTTGRVIIKGISFDLPAGEVLGIIGPSAAGKSTLARLLIGVWKPASGTVRLDGGDVSLWPREQLGRHLGYLPQDVELFSGTIAENIGRLSTERSRDIIEAATRAHAHEMILRLPGGYDTQIGEAGTLLSAGQRQRIALARALYGQPSLVLLDEPNSNLDGEGEAALRKTLAWLKAERITTILITHWPSLLVGVDKVLVLNDGAMEAFGPRGEIVARYVRQFGGGNRRHNT